MLFRSGGAGCDEVSFLVHGCWNSRDVRLVCLICQRVCEICNVIDHLVCLLGVVYNVCISHISLGPFGSICKISRFASMLVYVNIYVQYIMF